MSAHHPECNRCWMDLMIEHATDHACDCTTCVEGLTRHEAAYGDEHDEECPLCGVDAQTEEN